MSIERRRRIGIKKFVEHLKTKQLLDLNKAYDVVKETSGLYKCEIEGIVSALEDKRIESMVEIGRCLSGSIYLYLCCFPIKRFLSIDVKRYGTDTAIKEFMDGLNIQNEILVQDSSKYTPKESWDFVLIDGDHTGPGVKSDIEIWKNKCKYIGFHDYADRGSNRHRKVHPEVIKEITEAINKYGWKQIGIRRRSEIVLETLR